MSNQEYKYSIERYHDADTNITHVAVRLFPQVSRRRLTEVEFNNLKVLSWSYEGHVSEAQYEKMLDDMLDAYVNIDASRI